MMVAEFMGRVYAQLHPIEGKAGAMQGLNTSVADGNALIDITQVPLERLAELESPALSRLMDELAAKARQPERPFDFSSAV